MKLSNANEGKLKKQLIKKLIGINAFWSYDVSTDSNSIHDNLLIETTLLYGDVDEIQLLFSIFSKNSIRQVWEAKLIPDDRYYKLNFYLGLCFFGIKNIRAYINEKSQANSRYEKLRQLAELPTATAYCHLLKKRKL